MFRIKICGVTNLEDAIIAVDAGADAIGLNFYEKSPRCVAVKTARQIVSDIDGLAACWGVFVNMPLCNVEQVFVDAQLDGIQLHGDEPATTVAHFAKRLQPPLTLATQKLLDDLASMDPSLDAELRSTIVAEEAKSHPPAVICARRLDGRGVGAIRADLDDCRSAGGLPAAVLVDALTPGRYGGTGETVSWVGLADHRRWLGDIPLILAGGLTPDNVAEAIRIVRPYGVDVASGVESAPGKKDPYKVRDFVAAARGAFGG